MERKNIKSFINFINEGKREQDKIDELLEILSRRKLTSEERDLLDLLGKGGKLPEENIVYKKNKLTNDLETDDQGNPIVEENPIVSGKEFVTNKGKKNSVDKIKIDEIIDARVYKNKTSEENIFFVYLTENNEGVINNKWAIYRTGGSSDKHPIGQFMDVNNPRFSKFKNKTPDQMWKDLDFDFDYGMILDQSLYQDFIYFMELYKEDQIKHMNLLKKLRNRFIKLI